MTEYPEQFKIEELTLKSLEQPLTESEQVELLRLLKRTENLVTYQDTICMAASLQDIDIITNRIDSRIQLKPQWLTSAVQIAAVACITIAAIAGLKILNRPKPPNRSAVAESVFSQSTLFDRQAAQIEKKIQNPYPRRTQFTNGRGSYKHVKSEIKTLKQTPVF
ncbi:MAG: hypothetical protein ACYSOF_06155 [Planctomycetota bacterium]